MEGLRVFFIVIASMNALISIINMINRNEFINVEFRNICGWICAILFAIQI